MNIIRAADLFFDEGMNRRTPRATSIGANDLLRLHIIRSSALDAALARKRREVPAGELTPS
ncbi:hypothetical protein [Bradyrhizobium sp. B120]|uniref:hypothetical protein n=1 Tax=Bradyrhizobium sp. B120 TaxID=3410088 RepID=UPI003B9827D2